MKETSQKAYYQTTEHTNYVMSIIGTVALQVQCETTIPTIDNNLMVAGDEWVCECLLQNYKLVLAQEGGLSLANMPIITRSQKYLFEQPTSLKEVISRLYPNSGKVSLIPETEGRLNEARELGDVLEEQRRFLRLKTEKHEISVYKLGEFDFYYSIDDVTKFFLNAFN